MNEKVFAWCPTISFLLFLHFVALSRALGQNSAKWRNDIMNVCLEWLVTIQCVMSRPEHYLNAAVNLKCTIFIQLFNGVKFLRFSCDFVAGCQHCHFMRNNFWIVHIHWEARASWMRRINWGICVDVLLHHFFFRAANKFIHCHCNALDMVG